MSWQAAGAGLHASFGKFCCRAEIHVLRLFTDFANPADNLRKRAASVDIKGAM